MNGTKLCWWSSEADRASSHPPAAGQTPAGCEKPNRRARDENPTKKPGSPLDAIYRRVDLTPEQIFQALSRLRQEAQQQIEYLIALVDELDGDVDLEPDPTEQNLASVSQNAYHCDLEAHDDAEEDDCELEDGNDDEPSLGSVNPTMSGSQRTWGRRTSQGSTTKTSMTAASRRCAAPPRTRRRSATIATSNSTIPTRSRGWAGRRAWRKAKVAGVTVAIGSWQSSR
ncbi:hypothetical protein A4A58_13350 [Tardiphaga robiniae]|uniref:Uncharacterized protein n=1 Tax=Tardiphaga robiniae TaxID=943830 RepID=A0A163XU15_9BRAD|nr:hypothetical protein A4A58_13350 [Tardiphaga robiniae]